MLRRKVELSLRRESTSLVFLGSQLVSALKHLFDSRAHKRRGQRRRAAFCRLFNRLLGKRRRHLELAVGDLRVPIPIDVTLHGSAE